jgi:uncharacterized circularly permuted ATP-grasp superfamily protein/uncharacterized alpha-E superfamily protein
MLAPDGTVRPHWRPFVEELESAAPGHWAARTAAIQRLLLDHGVTYNIYSDAQSASREWALDAVPFLIAQEEWLTVAAGLQQRARLLNAILSDLYGPQLLLREGRLPPALVLAHPGYVRAACGVLPPGGSFLVNAGTDLVRGPQGDWMVLADRTQAPSGLGYAMENRAVMANVLGDVLASCNVRRLAEFHEAQRDVLRTLAPTRRGAPSVVLMTPGPMNETYFEHAYKARIMGYPLVEGADLTVRDRKLFLKTLDGLRRVDVVMRRVDELFADPLELNADTWIGVAGLCEAWRSGNVSLVNGIGTGVVETPALHPFLPGLCRHLLGEELKLACVPAWWCGQPRELQMVLADPKKWVLKPAFVSGAREPVFLDELSAAELELCLSRLRSEPHAWLAQKALNLSSTPAWNGTTLEPRPLVWRAFSVSAGDQCTVIPGGLSRVGPVRGRFLVTMQRGGISKDTWVVSEQPVPEAEAAPGASPVVLRPLRTPGGVPSRAADHLFWLGRYAERLEICARLLRATFQRLSGEGGAVQRRERVACLGLLCGMELVPPTVPPHGLRQEAHALLRHPERHGGVPELISRLRFNAAAARDRLSDDSWRLFNRLERDASGNVPAPSNITAPLEILDTLILDLAAFAGMQQENMTRGHGWRFLELGRRIERGLAVLTLTKAAARLCAADDTVLIPLLEVCDSSMTYRRLHFARPALLPVADLILLNEENPRSAAWQFRRLGVVINQLPANTRGEDGKERETLDVLRSQLGGVNLQSLTNFTDAAADVLPAVCDRLHEGLEALSAEITTHFFSHARGREF